LDGVVHTPELALGFFILILKQVMNNAVDGLLWL
jgi:hypothetical protein